MGLDSLQWASETFKDCALGDKRRTDRLIAISAMLADSVGASLHGASKGESAATEGAYRFSRNSKVIATEIEAGPWQVAAKKCTERRLVLAVEDSTTLGYSHSAAKQMGDLGGKKKSKKRGIWAHTVLGVDADNGDVLGILDQQRWIRSGERKKRGANKKRAYEDKESMKWQRSSERVASRMATMANIISVCDREADVHEYLAYKHGRGERFVVRASWDRRIEEENGYLFDYVASLPISGEKTVDVPQKGGRPARKAHASIRFGTVTIKPDRHKHPKRRPFPVRVVDVREEHPPKGKEALHWMLFTREAVENLEDAKRIIGYYQRRWTIEDFHKAWKTGCGVEKLRLQEVDNIQRIAVVLSFVAVRLLQLRAMDARDPEAPCDAVLPKALWVCLWLMQPGEKPALPDTAPSVRWALEQIGRLGGHVKTKQCPRAGWLALSRGMVRLESRTEGMLIGLNLGENERQRAKCLLV